MRIVSTFREHEKTLPKTGNECRKPYATRRASDCGPTPALNYLHPRGEILKALKE